MAKLLLLVALASCAPLSQRPATWRYAADFVGMSAGAAVGMSAQFDHPQDRAQMFVGYGVALALWLPYWVVSR